VNAELARFLVVGVTAVAIDFATYRLLLAASMGVALAKALGFVAGAIFAYIANRDWTFRAAGGTWVLLRFSLLYAASLGCNVAANAGVLAVLPPGEIGRLAAFVSATLLSATINFVGMKFLVFRPSPSGALR
jgi:putative flippase GtrA